MSFGPHLMVDLKGIPEIFLTSKQVHQDFLEQMPAKLGMTIIHGPHVLYYCDPNIPQDDGWTGTVIIAESHLSIHSFRQKGYAFIDIFSCKPFDTEAALKEIINRFQPISLEFYTVERGKDFPRWTLN